jgi:hypothetical protein
VSAGLVALGVAVVAGAIVAVGAHEGRVALLGLALTLVVAPLISGEVPAALPLAARLVAAILASFLLWAAIRPVPGRTRGSRVGWPVDSLLAAAAALVGLGLGGVSGTGVPVAMAVGVALLALALAPLRRPDALQVAIGIALLVTGAATVRIGVAGTPLALEQLLVALSVVAVGGAGAIVAASAIATGGTLDLASRGLDAAHPSDEPSEALRPWPHPRLRR